jgi:hypothetical protein
LTDSRHSTEQMLTLARRAIESGRDSAEIPNGYVNFDLALSIVDGCRSAINMADAHDPNTIIPKLETASAILALVQAGVAESSVKAARTFIDEAVVALRHSSA